MRNYIFDSSGVEKKLSSGARNKTKQCRYKDGDKIRGLLVCSNRSSSVSECVSPENKHITFRNRDKNGVINIMNLAKYYMRYKARPPVFCHSFCFSPSNGGVS